MTEIFLLYFGLMSLSSHVDMSPFWMENMISSLCGYKVSITKTILAISSDKPTAIKLDGSYVMELNVSKDNGVRSTHYFFMKYNEQPPLE